MNRRPATPLVILRERRQQRGKERRGFVRRLQRLGIGFGSILGILGALLLIALAFSYATVTTDLPPMERLEALLDPSSGYLLHPTRLYDRDGQVLLATLAPVEGERLFLTYEQIPQGLVNATLVLAQPDFWQSPGYVVGGWQEPDSHPTLAQRLVFDFLLADEPPSRTRALRERLLAAQATAEYGREVVIAWVLNSTDFGNYTYGAEAASMLYFGKSATQLSLSEAALLAFVGQAPALNPLEAPQYAEVGRRETLSAMLRLGWITEEEALAAVDEVPVILPPAAAEDALLSPQYVELLLRQLDTSLGAGRVERGGVIILTTIEYSLQLQADCALRTQLARLGGNLEPLLAQDGSACTAAALLARVDETDSDGEAAAGALVLDPATGQVLAAAGDLSSHPAGTAITPFLYLTGFARGLNPATLVWDIPGEEPVLGQVYQGPMRLRIALANDYLNPAWTVLEQMGVENIRTLSTSFGLDLPAEELLKEDFALSPFDLASAHGILAVGGEQNGQMVVSSLPGALAGDAALQPASVLQVFVVDGSLLLDWTTPESRLVTTPELAYLMTHVLSDEEARRPSLGAYNALEIDLPVAVKASRSLDETGAWTIGYTPGRVMVVYVEGAGSSTRPASDGLWSALTRTAVKDLPSTGWEMPAGVDAVRVCDPSGQLPTEACPSVVEEVFLDGRQPVQYDSLYQEFAINKETGLLATVYTPPELIERRVYMVPPPEAREWAAAVGIEVPPAAYDNYRRPPLLPDAHITTPAGFADVRGLLEIRGTAAGEDFVSYRLEYGAGLNPEGWFLIGEDVTAPVTESLLGAWDTAGLDGLYTLRLMVLRSENRVDEALLQVTLDNTPPEIVIVYPQEGQEVSLAEDAYILIQTEVQESYPDEVVFYMDGEEVGNATTSPYWMIWTADAGEHTLRVVATDRVGNTGETELHFTVTK